MQHDDDQPPDEMLDPWVEHLLKGAHAVELDIETAARHLWSIHRHADPARHGGALDGALGPTPASVSARSDALHALDALDGLDVPPRDTAHRAGTQQGLRRLVGAGTRGFVIAIGFLTVLSTSGVAVAASSSALPGEILYPVKLSSERVKLLVSIGEQRDARLHLKIARARLTEAAAVAPARPTDALGLLTAAVDAMERAERSTDTDVRVAAAALREETGDALTSLAAVVGPSTGVDLVAERLSIASVAQFPTSGSDALTPPAAAPSETPERSTDRAAAPRPRPLPTAPATDPPPRRALPDASPAPSEIADAPVPLSSLSSPSPSAPASAAPTPRPSAAAPVVTSDDREPSTKTDAMTVGPARPAPTDSAPPDGGGEPSPEPAAGDPEPVPVPFDPPEASTTQGEGKSPSLSDLADRAGEEG